MSFLNAKMVTAKKLTGEQIQEALKMSDTIVAFTSDRARLTGLREFFVCAWLILRPLVFRLVRWVSPGRARRVGECVPTSVSSLIHSPRRLLFAR